MHKLLVCLLFSNVVSQQIYNYYEFAVQKWCSDSYMIHGLWPQIDSENYPTYCEDVEYIEPIGELLQSMETYWQGCDDSLWSHEWEKHGSCMKRQNNITENDFFNITLELLENPIAMPFKFKFNFWYGEIISCLLYGKKNLLKNSD